MTIEWLDPFDPNCPFPPVATALGEPNGLLAAGGDLSPSRLLQAYVNGVFPWYEEGQPILWWSPNPRAVLYPEDVRISRSLRKRLRNRRWQTTFDRAFRDVISDCAAPRIQYSGTWITEEMLEAYCVLHAQGHAHSVEVWAEDNQLVGGLYGVAIGRVFFGESMFSWKPDASKYALVYLASHLQMWGYRVIDCQLPSTHLERLGAQQMERNDFIRLLTKWCHVSGNPSPWQVDYAQDVANWQPAAVSHRYVRRAGE